MANRRLVLCLLAVTAQTARAQAEEVRLHLVVHGAVTAEITVTHAADSAHFCSAAAAPWTDPDTPDPRPSPYPFYRLVFGQSAPGADLDRPGPAIGLALSDYFTGARSHGDPVNDSIELVLAGRHFVGHSGMRDPAYRLAASYREDRRGGALMAQHLRETGGRQATLDLEADWQCPPVAADVPARTVSVHTLFAGAVPARPDPTPLRLRHSDIPCVDRGCAAWRVLDEASGIAYLARVDLRRLRLARGLLRLAQRGQVDLLVGADIRPGNPPRIVAVTLDGIEPVQAAAAIPEAALP